MVSSESIADVSSTTADAVVEEKIDYVGELSDRRYSLVEDLRGHHFQSTSVPPTRALVRRLAQEFTDLSRSLPVTLDSSVFLRTKESQLNLARMLVIAPDQTPCMF